MARDLVQTDRPTQDFLAAAEDRLRLPLRRLMLDGPDLDLQATEHAQPAILFHSLAVLRHLTAQGITPAAVAGHSLGEFGGLVAAGGLKPLDALAAVRARGQAMAAAAPARSGMAAVLGLDDQTVERLCAESGEAVVAANFNAPRQVVISGRDTALDLAIARLEAAGARRIVRLPVSAAFHSPLMGQAAREFAGAWERVPLRRLRLPQVFNADAQVHAEPGEIRELMVRQLTGPVRWTGVIQKLWTLGLRTFVEVGPKQTLAGLVRKIVPEAAVHSVEGLRGIEQLAGALRA